MQTISVGLIGFGTVGTGVVKILQKNAGLLYERLGAKIELEKIADLDIRRSRGVKLKSGMLTTSADAVITDPKIDIVIELMGGIEPARSFILKAIANGKHVITANKALLSEHGWEIFAAARRRGVDVAFEASVGGGIPIIRTVQEGFASDRITGFLGILNGTSNYILSRMTDEGADFKTVLKTRRLKAMPRPTRPLMLKALIRPTSSACCSRLPSAAGQTPKKFTPRAFPASPPLTSRLPASSATG